MAVEQVADFRPVHQVLASRLHQLCPAVCKFTGRRRDRAQWPICVLPNVLPFELDNMGRRYRIVFNRRHQMCIRDRYRAWACRATFPAKTGGFLLCFPMVFLHFHNVFTSPPANGAELQMCIRDRCDTGLY